MPSRPPWLDHSDDDRFAFGVLEVLGEVEGPMYVLGGERPTPLTRPVCRPPMAANQGGPAAGSGLSRIAYTDGHHRCARTLGRWIGSNSGTNSGTLAAQSGARCGAPDRHVGDATSDRTGSPYGTLGRDRIVGSGRWSLVSAIDLPTLSLNQPLGLLGGHNHGDSGQAVSATASARFRAT